jgi:hypothetical protein
MDVSSTPATLATVSTNSAVKRVALAAMATAVPTALIRASARVQRSSISLLQSCTSMSACLRFSLGLWIYDIWLA